MKTRSIQHTLVGLFSSILLLCPAVGSTQAQTLQADVVVVGGGAAGLAASVSAAQKGAKVILLEKEPTLGGAARYAEGLFAVETEQLRKDSSPLTKDEIFLQAMEFNHWEADAALVHKVIDESPTTIAWLGTLGLDFVPTKMAPDEPLVWHVIQEYKGAHHGAALIAALADHAKELGVNILVSTPATGLIIENGNIAGVNATDSNGNKLAIHAKAVVLGTGGFPANKEMIAKYTRFDPSKVFATVPLHKTGDGINMAVAAGADTDHALGLMLHAGAIGEGVTPLGNIFTMSWQPLLWVNKYGDRFCNEEAVFSFPFAANAIYRQPDSFGWEIWDDETIKYEEKEGVDVGIGVLVPVTTKLTGLRAEIAKAEEKHATAFVAANSVEELAKKINTDPARLQATIDKYNAIQERGRDASFAKNPRYASPVKTGRLYALRIVPMFFTTIGGVKVDTDFRATTAKDQTIPGLYIAGSDMGGNFGDTYTLWTSGYAFGLAVTSGRVSGAEAAAFAASAH